MGKKTRPPGKHLQTFIEANFGIQLKEKALMVETSSDAAPNVVPHVRDSMAEHPRLTELDQRMLLTWADEVRGLRDQRVYALGTWSSGDAFEGLSAPPKLESVTNKIGQSPLMGKRS